MKSQISVEYLLVVGFSLTILIPGIFIFLNYIQETDDLVITRSVESLANRLLEKGELLYYYGENSQTILRLKMPRNIVNMYILFVPPSTTSKGEYYLVFQLSPDVKLFFESNIPLDYQPGTGEDIYECSEEFLNTHAECLKGICLCFTEDYYREGIKNFNIKITSKCMYNNHCMKIKEISNLLK